MNKFEKFLFSMCLIGFFSTIFLCTAGLTIDFPDYTRVASLGVTFGFALILIIALIWRW